MYPSEVNNKKQSIIKFDRSGTLTLNMNTKRYKKDDTKLKKKEITITIK